MVPGPFVRAEPRRQSEERLQGWSSWIWTRESVSSHCLCEQSVRSALWGETNQEISSQADLQVGNDCS